MDSEVDPTGLSDSFPYSIACIPLHRPHPVATLGPIATAPLELNPAGPNDCPPHTTAPDWNVDSLTFGFFDLDFLPLEYIQCFQNSFDQANLPPPPNGGGLSMISDEQSVQGSFSYLSTVPPLSGAYPQIITVPAASDGGGRDPYHELWLTGDFHSFSTVPAINPPALTSPPARAFPANWIEIPQRNYDHGSKQLDFRKSEPTPFDTGEHPGINLRDALRKDFARLNGRDDPMVQYASGVMSCRLLFPGYPDNGNLCQIHTLNWKKTRKPISRSKLAYEVARRVNRYLTHMAGVTPDGSVNDCWRIGQGFMHIDNMFLVSLASVSKGSFQPEIWVAVPSTPPVPIG